MVRLAFLFFFLQASIGAVAPYLQIMLRNKGLSHSAVGAIMAVGELASILVPVVVSALADRIGKSRPLLLICSVLAVLFFIPSALSSSVVFTILCFFVAQGCFWSLNPMADALGNRILKGDPAKYGLVRSAGTFGYIVVLIGFGFSGFPATNSNSSILTSIAMITLIFSFVCLFIPKSWNYSVEGKEKFSFKKMFNLKWFDRPFLILIGIIFLTRIAQSLIDKLLAAYMTEVLGLGGRFTLFVALGAFGEFLMIIFGGRLLRNKVVSPWFMITLSALALTIRLLLYYFFASSLVVFGIAQLLHSFTFGALHIATSRFISEHVDKSHFALAMSFYWCIATNVPNLIGSLAGGFIIEYLGYGTLFLSYSVFPAVAFILCLVFRKTLTAADGKVKGI